MKISRFDVILGTAGAFAKAWKLIWSTSWRLASALIALTAVSALLLPVAAIIGKEIIDKIVESRAIDGPPGSYRSLALLIATELVVAVIIIIADRCAIAVRHIFTNKIASGLSATIVDHVATFPLSQFEDSEFYDKLNRIRREVIHRPGDILRITLVLGRASILFGGYALIIAQTNLLVMATIILGYAPALLADIRAIRIEFGARKEHQKEGRKAQYLEHIIGTDEYIKERIVYGISDCLAKEHRALQDRLQETEIGLSTIHMRRRIALALFSCVCFFMCYATVIVDAGLASISIGRCALLMVALRNIQSSLNVWLSAVNDLLQTRLYIDEMLEFIEDVGVAKQPELELADGETMKAEKGLRFDGVFFKYKEQGDWVLRDVSIFIPEGQFVALSGANGSGKSTFLKLALGLYRPTKGRILMDGKTVDQIGERQYMDRFAAMFQDFSRYHWTVRRNVDLTGADISDGEVESSLSKSGAWEFVQRLPGGLDAQLGTWFDHGKNLSGGQWQRIALARAFAKPDVRWLVLDEPTSAMDSLGEETILSALGGKRRDLSILLVSHRLSSLSGVDRVLSFEEGRIHDKAMDATTIKPLT